MVLPKANPKETIPDSKFSRAKVQYTSAIIDYWEWRFLIKSQSIESYNTQSRREFEIKCQHKRFSEWTYLKDYSFWLEEAPKPETMERAIGIVKDFINNELQ